MIEMSSINGGSPDEFNTAVECGGGGGGGGGKVTTFKL